MTYYCECPPIVADYGRLVIFEDGYLQREGNESQENLGDVQAQLEAWEVLGVPFELAPAHLVQ